MHLAALLACTGGEPDTVASDSGDTTADTADTNDTTGGDTVTVPDGTTGQTPAESLPPIEFAATNYDGSARGIADITDGPTVMWFFPSSGTYG